MRGDADGSKSGIVLCSHSTLWGKEIEKPVVWSLPMGDLRCSLGVKANYDEGKQDSIAWWSFSKKTGWVKDDKD